jgi:hypothetical protein
MLSDTSLLVSPGNCIEMHCMLCRAPLCKRKSSFIIYAVHMRPMLLVLKYYRVLRGTLLLSSALRVCPTYSVSDLHNMQLCCCCCYARLYRA